MVEIRLSIFLIFLSSDLINVNFFRSPSETKIEYFFFLKFLLNLLSVFFA